MTVLGDRAAAAGFMLFGRTLPRSSDVIRSGKTVVAMLPPN
jgi:hypothetical protein